MKERLKQMKGITLIALVITIIVLLILAGVSIAMLTGENGILTQAQKAKNETENAQVKEENILDEYEDYLNRVTGDVPQVDDSNPGVLEGNGKEQEPYTINSMEDLVSFADSVTNGNTYEGKYVKLNQSLDFRSDKSYIDPNRENYYGYTGKLKEALTTGEGFKPIGTTIIKDNHNDTSNSFCGYFDGNGKIIYNSYMNKDTTTLENKEYFGFFGMYLYGEVKNLGLANVNYSVYGNGKTASISGITHLSFGKIINCYVSGNISATQNGNYNVYCTGIANNNRGIIENSYNLATIKGKINVTDIEENSEHRCYCAGITINNEAENAEIRNCYNSGEIYGETNSRIWT